MNNSISDALSSDNPKRNKTSKPKIDKEASNVIKDALLNYIKSNSGKFYKEDCAAAAAATLQEFLQAFVIIGYDFQGTPIKIIQAHNGQEADALSYAMQKYMMSSNSAFYNND
jgi:hypothetical protein